MASPSNSNSNRPKTPRPMTYYYLGVFALLLFFQLVLGPMLADGQKTEISYTQFTEMLEKGRVLKVTEDGRQYVIEAKDENGALASYRTGLWDDSEHLTQLLREKGVTFSSEIPSPPNPWINLLFSLGVPLLIFWFLGRQLTKGFQSSGMMTFGKSNAKMYVKASDRKTFADVAGQEEAKESLSEIVDFLSNPKRYSSIGAICPKGILLVGPPGTGKTLMAKAVAGEANVPFFSISGSEFVELFVGMGASKVRDLFKEAKKKAPCIVFIDEIDAIGKRRDGAGFGGNDEREQTLNQLLNEMDGFEGNSGVVILAATNRPEILDPALTRPGRFDRQVRVELPDIRGREDILKVHSKDVKMRSDVNLKVIARMTAGASGADLANIINEGALRAVRMKRVEVSEEDLIESVEVVIAGHQKKHAVISEKEKKMIAYHEVGHALVAALQKHSAPVTKITIIPRTSGALGYTMQVDEEEKVLMSAEDLFNQIVTLTGGRSAEELIFHTKTTGASNDIERATKIARSMVTRFGMTEDFDFIALETVQNQYLGGDAQLAASQGTAKSIDDAVRQIITKAHQTALDLLREYEQQLHDIAQFLLQKETITGEEFMDVLERSLAFYGKKMPEKEVLKEEIAGEMPAALEPALEPSSEEGVQEKDGEPTSSPGSSTDVPVQPLVEDSFAEGQEALEEEQTSVSSDVSEDKSEN